MRAVSCHVAARIGVKRSREITHEIGGATSAEGAVFYVRCGLTESECFSADNELIEHPDRPTASTPTTTGWAWMRS